MDIKLEIKNEIIYSNSLEIAENIGVEHKRVLRKYDDKNKYFNQTKNGLVDNIFIVTK